MKRKFTGKLGLALIFCGTLSCTTTQDGTSSAALPVPEPAVSVNPLPFDPKFISEELKQTTLVDIAEFINNLNSVIQRKDFEVWKSYLSPEYIAYYSSEETLAKWSDTPVLKRQGIKLTSLADYFLFVVYPSRDNTRPDDVEYYDYDRIKAMAINPKGERIILYYLEKNSVSWKITIRR